MRCFIYIFFKEPFDPACVYSPREKESIVMAAPDLEELFRRQSLFVVHSSVLKGDDIVLSAVNDQFGTPDSPYLVYRCVVKISI